VMRKWGVIASFLIIVGVVIGISYHIVQKFAYARTHMLKNRPYHEVAQEMHALLGATHNAQRITFTTQDGKALAGLWLERPHAAGTMVVCHGYRRCKERHIDLIDLFPAYNMLLFDFRGHGQSDDAMVTFGFHEYHDVSAAVAWVKKQALDMPVIILGYSMGGAAALKAVGENACHVDALIIDSTFSDLPSTLARGLKQRTYLPVVPFAAVAERIHDIVARCACKTVQPCHWIATLKCPVFIIHSVNDDITPVTDALELYAAARHTCSKLWITPHASHAAFYKKDPANYAKKVAKFLTSYLFPHG
jgi:alpha-beta hydrolase superfamily lysophospholipase